MALSNILREPRREITESAVGILAVGAVAVPALWLDYLFAVWFREVSGGDASGVPWPVGIVIGALLTLAAVLFFSMVLAATHAAGEGICNALQRRGIYLRPRERR